MKTVNRKMPNFSIAKSFVTAYLGNENSIMRLRCLKKGFPSRETWGTITDLWPFVEEAQRNGYAVYYFINQFAGKPGSGKNGAANDLDCTDIRSAAVDCDGGIPQPKECHLQPGILIRTSPNRCQILWPYDDATKHKRQIKGFRADQLVLAKLYEPWGADKSCINPSRIFRLPGTLNFKHDPPHLVTFDLPYDYPVFFDREEVVPEVRESNSESKLNSSLKSTLTGLTVDRTHLEYDILPLLNPDVPYPEWRDIVAAIGSSPVEKTEEIAVNWSRGDYWKGNVPTRWTGEEAVLEVLRTMPRKKGGVAYGTLYHSATMAGYKGRPGGNKQADFSAAIAKLPLPPPLPYYTFSEIIGRTPKPVEELIPGWLERGITTFLCGVGKTHKSRLTLQWGLSLASGIPIWGIPSPIIPLVYLSYEDGIDEITRRVHAQSAALGIRDADIRIFDLKTKTGQPFADVTETEIVPTEFFHDLSKYLRSNPGHKLIVADSCYNVLRFAGPSKINETAVREAVGLLDRFCIDNDCTLIVPWHPSQAGDERGDASGWSVAWVNAPRARLTLRRVPKEECFELKVSHRNNGPAGAVIQLYFERGILVHKGASVHHQELVEASVAVATMLFGQGTPLKKDGRLRGEERRVNYDHWALGEIERRTGYAYKIPQILAALEDAEKQGRVRYIVAPRGSNNQAGYAPWDTEDFSRPSQSSDN